MSVLFLQVFVSLCLVAGAVALYVFTVGERTFEHADRLALAPLDEDEWREESATPLDEDERPAAPESPTPPVAPVREERS